MHLLFLLACHTTKPESTPSGQDSVASESSTTDSSVAQEGFCGVQQLFKQKCVVCHSSSGHSGDLDLQTDAYAAIVNVPSAAYPGQTLVIPGSSSTSFLYLKMAGLQKGSEGSLMPPSKAVPPEDLALVAAWIDGGASSECASDSGTTTTPTGYHPGGYADPSKHGMDAKFQRDTCLSCHGEDLSGGSAGVSCDGCHSEGWRSNCTFCHGGIENGSGAPPEDINDSKASLAFPPHTEHVAGKNHPAYDCVQCHVKPADALDAGHFLLSDSTAGVAEAVFSGGLSPAGSYAGGTCSNLYCHGNGQGKNGSADKSDFLACGECHGVQATGEASWSKMSGQHHKHVNDAGAGCDTCHSTVVDSQSRIVGPDHHVDGTVDVATPAGMTYAGGKCTGTCHNVTHNGRSW